MSSQAVKYLKATCNQNSQETSKESNRIQSKIYAENTSAPWPCGVWVEVKLDIPFSKLTIVYLSLLRQHFRAERGFSSWEEGGALWKKALWLVEIRAVLNGRAHNPQKPMGYLLGECSLPA